MVGCLRGAVGFTPGATVDGGPTGECGVISGCHPTPITLLEVWKEVLTRQRFVATLRFSHGGVTQHSPERNQACRIKTFESRHSG